MPDVIESGRAQFAYDRAFAASAKSYKKEYKSYSRKIPSMIAANGLAAASAFIFSEKGSGNERAKAYDAMYTDITEALKRQGWPINDQQLVKYLIDLDSGDYKLVTNEALAFFSRLRRFAEGLIGD